MNRKLVGLNTTTVIPEINNQDLLDLINLEAKQINKKKEKIERRRHRKINLEQATVAGGVSPSPDTSVCCSPLFPVVSASNASGTSTGVASLSFVAGGDLLSAIFGYLLFATISDSPLSAVLGRLSSVI